MSIQSPIMFTPGSVRVSPKVWDSQTLCGQWHNRHPDVVLLLQMIRRLLHDLLGLPQNDYTFVLFPSSGRGAAEALLTAVIKVYHTTIAVNGRWGCELANMVLGQVPTTVLKFRENIPLPSFPFGCVVDPGVGVFVSHETEAGLLNPTGGIVAAYSGQSIVDITSSVIVDDITSRLYRMNAAAYMFNSSKGLRSVRDVGIVAVKNEFADTLPEVGGYFNFKAEWRLARQDKIPRVPFNVGVLFALLEALRELAEEGVHHRRSSIRETMGVIHSWARDRKIRPLVDWGYLGWATFPFTLPTGHTYPNFRDRLLEQGFDLTYSMGGPTGNTVEISTLGYVSRQDTENLLTACDKILGFGG